MYKPLVFNSRQSSQPRGTRSQKLSTEVVFLWTLHVEGQAVQEEEVARENAGWTAYWCSPYRKSMG